MFDYTTGSGRAVSELGLSQPRGEGGPLTYNIIFHKNLFLVQEVKKLICDFLRCRLFCGTVSQFCLTWVWITKFPL
jgi:hypothetical protein